MMAMTEGEGCGVLKREWDAAAHYSRGGEEGEYRVVFFGAPSVGG